MPKKGVYPILPTPFNASGALDLESLERLIDFQIEVGVSGVAILGFLGEAHKLAETERDQVVSTVVGRAAGSLDIWVGVRALGTMGAVEQAQRAAGMGAGAVFVAPIGVQDDAVLLEHYRTVSEAVEIPVIIHDFPASFGTTLSPGLIARLGKEGICKYIKLEDPPVGPKLTRIRELSGDKIAVFGGLGGVYFLEELERGAVGIMTGFAFPEVLVRIFRLFDSGLAEESARVFDHYAPLLRYEFQPKIGLAFRKFIFQRRGIFSTAFVRSPGMTLDAYTQEELARAIHRVGLRLDAAGVQPVI